jgi:hypothetical protein
MTATIAHDRCGHASERNKGGNYEKRPRRSPCAPRVRLVSNSPCDVAKLLTPTVSGVCESPLRLITWYRAIAGRNSGQSRVCFRAGSAQSSQTRYADERFFLKVKARASSARSTNWLVAQMRNQDSWHDVGAGFYLKGDMPRTRSATVGACSGGSVPPAATCRHACTSGP